MSETYQVDIQLTVPSSVSAWSLMPIASGRIAHVVEELFTVTKKYEVDGSSTDNTSFKRQTYAALRDTFDDHGLLADSLEELWYAGVPGDTHRVALYLHFSFVHGLSYSWLEIHVIADSKLEADRLRVECVKVLESISTLKRWRGAKFSIDTQTSRSVDEDAPKPLSRVLPRVGRRSLPKYLRDIAKRYTDQIIVGVIVGIVAGAPLVFLGVWIGA